MSETKLSVVVVTPERFRNIRRTVHALRQQSERNRIELLLVAPSAQAVDDREAAETAGFATVQVIAAGPIANVDHAAYFGIRAATCPIVAIIEDHAFPEPDWARHILDAHALGEWAIVGPTVVNANPEHPLSWTNLMIAYGWWIEGGQSGETRMLPGHNVVFRTSALHAYGTDLQYRLGRSGGLLDDLLERNFSFYFCAQARVAHLNPSRWKPTLKLRFNAGRLYAHSRANAEQWRALKRAAYFCLGPLIPLVRWKRVNRELFGDGRRNVVKRRASRELFIGLIADAAGQMAGYVFGPGGAPQYLAVFEMDRLQHLNATDRAAAAKALAELEKPHLDEVA